MNGICPNTGEKCDKLVEAYTIRREHIDASPSPFLPGAWVGLNAEAREAFNKNLQEGLRGLKLLGIAEQGSCIGSCALANVEVASFIGEQ